MKRCLLNVVIVGLLALTALGCSGSQSGKDSDENSPETKARELLTTALDSWMFGESIEKFKQAHPKIHLNDEREQIYPFGRPRIEFRDRDEPLADLVKYEIGKSRPGHYDGDFFFIVTLTAQDGNRETFVRNVEYKVEKSESPDIEWNITGTVDR